MGCEDSLDYFKKDRSVFINNGISDSDLTKYRSISTMSRSWSTGTSTSGVLLTL
jgi:hypothetical protein